MEERHHTEEKSFNLWGKGGGNLSITQVYDNKEAVVQIYALPIFCSLSLKSHTVLGKLGVLEYYMAHIDYT